MDTKIIDYSNSILRPFLQLVNSGYEKSKTVNIPYDRWEQSFLTRVYKNPKQFGVELIKKNSLVRYTTAKTMMKQYKLVESEIQKISDMRDKDVSRSEELNNEIYKILYKAFEPEIEFKYQGFETLDDLPIWFADSRNGVAMPLGTENLDLSIPYAMVLNDENPHSNLQGTSGSGKSVTMLELIMNLLLIFPPWEIGLQLIDGKIAEFHLFGRYVKTPHCNVIAATDNPNYLANLFEFFKEENVLRQELTNLTGTSGIKELREKFNLTIPRGVIIVDELAAIYQKIIDSSADGNEQSSEDKHAIDGSMQGVATKGRNVGYHLFISSQDLGDKLSKEVAGQLRSGIVLKGDSSISKACIGNTAGEQLDRRGIGIVNTDRLRSDNEASNIKVGIPFLNKDPVSGGMSRPQLMIMEMMKLAEKYNFKKEFEFYDAGALIAYSKYQESLKTSISTVQSNYLTKQCIIPMGKEICYTNSDIIYCDTDYKPGDGFIIDSKEDDRLVYLYNVILKTIEAEIVGRGLTIRRYSSSQKIVNLLELDIDNQTNFFTDTFPKKELSVYKARKSLMAFDEVMNSTTSLVTMFKQYSALVEVRPADISEETIQKYLTGELADLPSDTPFVQLKNFSNFLELYYDYLSRPASVENGNRIGPSSFEPRLVFWFDPQMFEDFSTKSNVRMFNDFFFNSPRVGFINVVNCSSWNSDCFNSVLDGCCRNVLEFSTKELYSAANLGPFFYNGNGKSFIYHDRFRRNIIKIIKFFGGIC